MFTIKEILVSVKGHLAGTVESSPVSGISTDTRTLRPSEAFFALKGPNFNGDDFIQEAIRKGSRCIVHQSPIKKAIYRKGLVFIKVKDTLKALADLARSRREKFNIPVIAVTGSNGKTTSKDMIACVLGKKLKVLKNTGTKNNQVGLPQTLLELDGSHDLAVLELGTNHFGEIKYLADICRPNIGIITNIGPSHLKFLKDLKGVLREKYSLMDNLIKPQIAILNTDDLLLKERISKDNKRHAIFGFGINAKSDFFASHIMRKRAGLEFKVRAKYRFTLNTIGYYNIYNALSAIAIGRIFGLSYKEMAVKLAAFKFPVARLDIRILSGIKFIDDTYNSNPLSLKQALDSLNGFPVRGRKIFVMGDMLELGKKEELFHRQAGRLAAKSCDVFIAVGKLSQLAADTARNISSNKNNIFFCKSNTEAHNILFHKVCVTRDDIILVKGSRAMRMEEVFKK